jgi:hypothetical protein
MAINHVHPTTLSGIKRLAKAIRRDLSITHTQALDQAAQAAGYQNLRHAQRSLDAIDGSLSRASFALYLTAYWRTRSGEMGRETLTLSVSVPWPTVLSARELKRLRHLRNFRADAPDHFETKEDIRDQSHARDLVCAAAREILFMAASGLRPASDAMGLRLRGLPGADHGSLWRDPATDTSIYVDEPYNDSPEFIAERHAWARNYGFVVATPTWPGMYAPGSSALYLIAFERFDAELASLAANLNKLPSPPVGEQWSGESASYSPVLVTPGREASGKLKRARPRPAYAGEVRQERVPYQTVFSKAVQWRPATRLPIKAHRRVGTLLQDLIAHANLPRRLHERLDIVRSDLDDWVAREYSQTELPQEVFSGLYYADAIRLEGSPVAKLREIIALLEQGYCDCGPRRRLVRTLTSVHRALDR